MGKIILGSSSPRRADILRKLKLDFEIIPSSYVEQHDQTDFSYEYVENLAYNKALEVAKNITETAQIIGADTIVVINNKILGKPKDKNDAYNMLKMLSGETHFVVTSIAVIEAPSLKFKIQSTTTKVTFEELSDEQIYYYIDNFKPFDKAGSYGIQELPKGYIKTFDGSLDNVIGLPSDTLLKMLDCTM
ncbi:MAG: Maf family protein [Candidatus Gastranaerophilales bacterium]|nr:Maf family protein [Candidatus Gastranaerophilales bacterium]